MKYMILVYGSQQDYDYDTLAGKDTGQPTASAEEFSAIVEFMRKFTGDLAASGELVDTQGLTSPALARRIQLRDGAQVVTDGPFAETEEVLAGYWLVECASFDRATEIAAQLHQCPGRQADAGVVVRPVDEGLSVDLDH